MLYLKFSVFRLSCFFLATFALLVSLPTLAQNDAQLVEKRKIFLEAEQNISQGNLTTARKLISSLGDYPLVPYLELEIMLRDLYRVPSDDIEAFIELHQNTWVGEKARLNWLVVLNSRRQYEDYIRHYAHIEPNTTYRCNYAYALIRTGRQEEAYEFIPDLWLVGQSQPDSCDKVFNHWRQSEAFTEKYIWQRFLLTRRAGQYGLSRYLTSLARTEEIQVRIQIYHRVRGNPSLAAQPSNFNLEKPGQVEIAEYGIRRIAENEPDRARDIYHEYRQLGVFDIVHQQAIIESLLKGWTDRGETNKALNYAQLNRDLIREDQIDWQLKNSLEDLQWQQVLSWTEFLDAESLLDDKWQYWIARAQNQLGLDASERYDSLAQKRSFYGHLASLLTEQPFHLENSYQPADPQLLESLRNSPGLQQSIELDAVRYFINSRNAWSLMLKSWDETEKMAAGQIAHEEGLHFSAIVTMARTGSWNNLSVRFPLAHQETYEKAASDNGLSLAWVYGISRQESSFAVDIRSPVGARGLMQVMPGTARDMSRKIDVRYDSSRLSDPAYNIPLGAAYLDEGLKELDDNMVYATAGYNAGISRAKQWLRDGKGDLPLDVWIETIPFRETRNYVKNVMAYSTIYADKLGIEAPLTTLSNQMFISLN